MRVLSEKLASRGKAREWDKVTKDQVPDYAALEALVPDLAGMASMTPAMMYKELGGSSREDMTITAWEAFLTLKDIYAPTPPA